MGVWKGSWGKNELGEVRFYMTRKSWKGREIFKGSLEKLAEMEPEELSPCFHICFASQEGTQCRALGIPGLSSCDPFCASQKHQPQGSNTFRIDSASSCGARGTSRQAWVTSSHCSALWRRVGEPAWVRTEVRPRNRRTGAPGSPVLSANVQSA